MKITKESLRTIILQELINTVSGTDQANRRIIMYRTGAYKTLVRDAFETLSQLEDSIRESGNLNRRNIEFGTGPFATLIRTAFETLERVEDSIRSSSNLEKMDLNGLKDNEVERLRDKISFIESFIDEKLEG